MKYLTLVLQTFCKRLDLKVTSNGNLELGHTSLIFILYNLYNITFLIY